MAESKDPDNNLEYEVKPVSAEDVPPPPSYEDVFGQYVTSVKQEQTTRPSLAYIDIMPRLLHPGNIRASVAPAFQSFNDLVVGANTWLRDNPGLNVWKCETVERKVTAGRLPGTVAIDLDNVVQHEATYGFNCFVFGLRLWLTSKTENECGIQEIGLMNIFPLEKKISVNMYESMVGAGRFSFGGLGLGVDKAKTMITYEGLKRSLEAFNKNVKENPIPGTILNIESTTLKFAEGPRQITIQEAASSATWCELNNLTSKRYTQILRIFYVKGKPTAPEICMKEFLPTQLEQPTFSLLPVRFDKFPSVINEAAVWVQRQEGIQIANIETRFADVNQTYNTVEIDTDCTDHFELDQETASKLRFLRIIYLSNPSVPSFGHTWMSCRLFVPIHQGGTKFESMTQTMTRIDQWMRLTGLPIFGVETVPFLKEDVSGSAQDRCDFNLKPFSAKYWVNAIRVYFPSAFQEPAYPNPFPPQLPAISRPASISCDIL